MLPLAERETIRFRDTIESPPTRFLLGIQTTAGYNMLGVDFRVEGKDGSAEFYRGAYVDPSAVLVAILSPQTRWIMVRREEFDIYTTRQALVYRKQDADAQKALYKEIVPEEVAEAERISEQLRGAGSGVNVAVLPEGHGGRWL